MRELRPRDRPSRPAPAPPQPAPPTLTLLRCPASHVKGISLAGTTGKKFAGIRKHLEEKISKVYNGLDVATTTFPADDVARDPEACASGPLLLSLSLAVSCCARVLRTSSIPAGV